MEGRVGGEAQGVADPSPHQKKVGRMLKNSDSYIAREIYAEAGGTL
jgi:hypothetical protein